VEYDDGTKDPLALIETAMDRGQTMKPATVTKKLAERCSPQIKAYILLYKLAQQPNPADPKWPDIESFRVKRIWPEPETPWRIFTPEEWAYHLLELRSYCARSIDLAAKAEKLSGGSRNEHRTSSLSG